MPLRELTIAFKHEFKTKASEAQIRAATKNRRILSGRTGRFEKGHESWNKGTKGLTSANSTSFRKGHIPPNRKPVGAERIDSKDGYLLVKIKERDPDTGFPTRYKLKHVHLWEKKHGSVLPSYVVAFKDGDKLNCSPENLMLIMRNELLSLNLHGYGESPAELKPSILALAKLEAAAGIRTRSGRGRKKEAA